MVRWPLWRPSSPEQGSLRQCFCNRDPAGVRWSLPGSVEPHQRSRECHNAAGLMSQTQEVETSQSSLWPYSSHIRRLWSILGWKEIQTIIPAGTSLWWSRIGDCRGMYGPNFQASSRAVLEVKINPIRRPCFSHLSLLWPLFFSFGNFFGGVISSCKNNKDNS